MSISNTLVISTVTYKPNCIFPSTTCSSFKVKPKIVNQVWFNFKSTEFLKDMMFYLLTYLFLIWSIDQFSELWTRLDFDMINNFFSDRELSEERPHVMLNQFPCESLVTVKDCLAAVARRVNGGLSPDWLPKTFNLHTELPQFIKHYQRRQQRFESEDCLVITHYYIE